MSSKISALHLDAILTILHAAETYICERCHQKTGLRTISEYRWYRHVHSFYVLGCPLCLITHVHRQYDVLSDLCCLATGCISLYIESARDPSVLQQLSLVPLLDSCLRATKERLALPSSSPIMKDERVLA